MSRHRTHYFGDGCEPPHVVVEVPAEDPDVVRARDAARWSDVNVVNWSDNDPNAFMLEPDD